MMPARQIGKSRAVARAMAKNAGIPPRVFDRLWDEYEKDEYKRRKDWGAIVARYANPEVTEAFEILDKKEVKMSSFRKRFGNLTVAQVIEMNETSLKNQTKGEK